MAEIKFWEIIQFICKKPRGYTRDGTFLEVVIFLEGYALGANVGNNASHSKLTPFLQWVAFKFETGKSCINWDEFRQIFLSDEEALMNLPILYGEYLQSSFYKDRLDKFDKIKKSKLKTSRLYKLVSPCKIQHPKSKIKKSS